MTNARDLKKASPVRMMVVGYPGSGKTGALASLVNAGYKLRILDYDGNLDPLWHYCDEDKLANVDILQFEDKLRNTSDGMAPEGIPTAFNDGLKAMKEWKYMDGDTEVNLGKSSEWGLDTVFVLDSMTALGRAAKRRAMKMMNKTPRNFSQPAWGAAINDQEAFIEQITSPLNHYHVIVMAHLRMIGPKMPTKDDDDLVVEAKKAQAELVPTRLYPSALGWDLPQHIAEHFPVVVRAQSSFSRTRGARRFLTCEASEELDLKLPVQLEGKELDVADGYLRIFKALGHDKPGE